MDATAEAWAGAANVISFLEPLSFDGDGVALPLFVFGFITPRAEALRLFAHGRYPAGTRLPWPYRAPAF